MFVKKAKLRFNAEFLLLEVRDKDCVRYESAEQAAILKGFGKGKGELLISAF